MDINVAADLLVKLIVDATYLPFAIGFVVAATALVKNLPFVRDHFTGGVIAITFQVIIWVVWEVAKRAGVDFAQFQSALDALTTILSGIAGLVAASYGAHVVYTKAAACSVPLIGKPSAARVPAAFKSYKEAA